MASTDGFDGNPVDVTEHATERVEATQVLPGDDITVIPDPHDGGNRRRAAWIAGAVAAVVLVAGAFVLATRDDDPNASVATGVSATTIAETPNAAATTVPKLEKPATTLPTASAAPGTTPIAPVPVPVPQNPVVVAPPPTVLSVAPTTLVAPTAATAIAWVAPESVTIKTGASKTIAIIAKNTAEAPVSLPHPLSCAPTLDNSGVCAAMLQQIPAGQSAHAQWTVSAVGIAPGSYTLNYAGLLKIPVTVTAK